MRLILRRIGWGLIGAAGLVFAFLGYQLFVTDLLNDQVQAEARQDLDAELAARRAELPAATEVTVPPPTTPEESNVSTTTVPEVEWTPENPGGEGQTLGRMVIDKLEVDEVIFSGVARDTLKMGPGHMLTTPVPGQPGNAVISGHRTTYGRPFYDLDQLAEGDQISVETATGTHVYQVRRSLIVEPTDVWVTAPIDGAWLTLTTCHPQFSAAKRLVIQAELVSGPNLEYANTLAMSDGEDRT